MTKLPATSEQPNHLRKDVSKAQEAIYQLLLDIVKTWASEDVLEEFKHLFIHHTDKINSNAISHLFNIVFSNQEAEFRNTLKRSCYILINNWDMSRDHPAIHQLIQLFSDPILYKPTISPTLKRLREWLRNFVISQDFQELKLFAARYESEATHWTKRYTSYLLVAQYTNLENSVEQRQVARNLSKKLREKFKFELAMYTALASQTMSRSPKNPTGLGDEVLRLIKRIVAKRGFFSDSHLANLFLCQIKSLRYSQFKKSLLDYLLFSIEDQEFAQLFRTHLLPKLQDLYVDHDTQEVDDALRLRTVNRLIEHLTTENREEPASLFVLLLAGSNPIALVRVLLKLILLCPYARTHLDLHVAGLIRYYETYSEEEGQWVINFFELLNITLTIFTGSVEYNIVIMDKSLQSANLNSETYRIFSQARSERSAQPQLEEHLDPAEHFDGAEVA